MSDDPVRLGPAVARLARSDYLFERAVEPNLEGLFGKDAPECAPHVDRVHRQDASRVRRVPDDWTPPLYQGNIPQQ